MRKTKKIGGSNVLVTVLLFLGCLTILFPLWTTSKKPWKLQTSGTPLETAC